MSAVSEPAWLALLRGAVARLGTIKAVADQLGYSRTAISLVLAGKYGDRSTTALERAVMTRLDQVACPVLGEIAGEDCAAHQAAPFSASNPQRIALYRACRAGCPHSRRAERAS
ncbi:MAG TPA: transcriptional regulator [Aliidongia sp.]|nr:transcriptional regulator [Aliidongia sp.]